ncbi:MAG: PH domain-containing protein, partial [Actinomycetes bacterium]
MTFPARLLNPGEEVVLDVRPHWWYLAGPVAVAVLVLAGAVATGVLQAPAIAVWVVVAVLAASLSWLVIRYLRWANTRLFVTTDRLIHRRGLVARTGREIPLEHLSDVSYRQSILQRLLGAGDMRLESAGRDSAEVFTWLPHPGLLQNEIYRQIDSGRARVAGGRGLSMAEQLEKLDE